MQQPPNVYDAEPIPETARDAIETLLKSGDLFRYTAPEDAPASVLERDFAAMIGARYAVAVSSCSAALFLALKALELPRGARVLIPAFTFGAVPSAVVHADCVPVLVAVNETLRIDIDDFAAKLDGADAVLISHMRGHTSDMDRIMELADAAGLPVIEDAAHSLGTKWADRNIGTIGRIGCFSFQSYKLLNSGEGGILITDDADIAARAVIMSGAYEHNWKKHAVPAEAFARWQNKLPLYNTRLSNLSAVLVQSQLPEVERRVRDGRRNHDFTAERLERSPFITVPKALPSEERAPDSIQFLLNDMSRSQIDAFVEEASRGGVSVQVFGLTRNNARAFWNWDFLDETPDLPETRAVLERACDVRLPARLTLEDCSYIADVLVRAAKAVQMRDVA